MAERIAVSPQEFADMVGESRNTVMAYIHRAVDPLPAMGTGGRGNRYKVNVRLGMEWYERQTLKDTQRRTAM